MIFSVQRYLEDLFSARGFSDPDQYAVKIANIYSTATVGVSSDQLEKSFRRVRTNFFKANSIASRKEFEAWLTKKLRTQFKKKISVAPFLGDLSKEKQNVSRQKRLSINFLLNAFRGCIEARTIDTFWKSRTKSRLHPKPEKIGQGLLATFLVGVLVNRPGHLIRELSSGIGFVDIAIILSTVIHLIELKVLTSSTFTGIEQLETYMKIEERTSAWLIIFDANPPGKKPKIPKTVTVDSGIINIVVININPVVPSSLSR